MYNNHPFAKILCDKKIVLTSHVGKSGFETSDNIPHGMIEMLASSTTLYQNYLCKVAQKSLIMMNMLQITSFKFTDLFGKFLCDQRSVLQFNEIDVWTN